jgi:hypothetical protein
MDIGRHHACSTGIECLHLVVWKPAARAAAPHVAALGATAAFEPIALIRPMAFEEENRFVWIMRAAQRWESNSIFTVRVSSDAAGA